jgi:putative addiction module component (TIGR02574 family)
MSSREIAESAMALPLAERVSLAQQLWESIDSELPETTPEDALADAIRRGRELDGGIVTGRSHEEVMQAARRAIGCD